MLFVLINVLIIVVIGAICFYLIDRFVRDGRLANLLKILVVLVCVAAILQRLLPASWLKLLLDQLLSKTKTPALCLGDRGTGGSLA